MTNECNHDFVEYAGRIYPFPNPKKKKSFRRCTKCGLKDVKTTPFYLSVSFGFGRPVLTTRDL